MDKITVVTPREMVNQEEYDEFAKKLGAALEAGAQTLVVDCSVVRYMNSSAIGLLVGAYMTLSERGGGLRLVAPDRVIQRSFEMVGLYSLIEVFPTLEEAVTE